MDLYKMRYMSIMVSVGISFYYLIGYPAKCLVSPTSMTEILLEFLTQFQRVKFTATSSIPVSCCWNACFHLTYSPSHWHAPWSITNSGFFSCLISSQSAFVRTFLILNTWINYIFALCQPQSCEHMNVQYITKVVSIFQLQNKPQKANYI